MRIIYGLAGQGFGHSARSREILKHLAAAGHDIKVFTYGQGAFFLHHDFDVFEIPGLTLSYKNNKVRYFKTLLDNTKKVYGQTRQWNKIKKVFKDFAPELVITDFEPLTALLAKKFRLPLISIDNQHQLTNTEIQINKKHLKDLMADKAIIKLVIWSAKYYLVTSFFKTKIKKKNTYLFAPIIRQEVLDMQPAKDDYFLVYEGADMGRLTELFKRLPYKFVVFGPQRQGHEGNIVFKHFDTHEWLMYLNRCRAVIGTAGLSLLSEAIYLKKPYLALPIKHQVEQLINAQYLQRLGYGQFSYDLTSEEFEDFVAHLPQYEERLAFAEACGNKELFEKLDEIIANS
ncbi:MAG: MJ1255/VC2487 family glycosyltransferase [Patescibacteria group bacterium]